MTATNSKFAQTSMIEVRNQYSNIDVTDSKFLNLYSTGRAPVGRAKSQGTLRFENSQFCDNFAQQAAIFKVEDGSLIEVSNSTFRGSLSLQSGLFFISSNGQLTVRNSVINENYAYSTVLFEIVDSQKEIILDNVTVSRNHHLSFD